MAEERDFGLEIGRVYTAEELSSIFGFKPYYLRTAGGMISVPRKGSLLLITHAEHEASFEYGDYWDGDHLVYTGRGQDGDQVLDGQNRDVAENRRTLWIFERSDKFQRRYLGRAVCTAFWWAFAPDKSGIQRRVLRFSLRLDVAQMGEPNLNRLRRPLQRRPRSFDETRTPAPPSPGVPSSTPEEIAQLNEKASAAHHALLVALKRWLEGKGWTDIEEIPAAVDLWARHNDLRVLFEAKTITRETELAQTRAALAQLLEYRFFYGAGADQLCLVANAPLSDQRLRFLSGMGIHALWHDGKKFMPCAGATEALFAPW
jgi:hypothetical protein